ncbi:MAG: hypothetical protein M1429_00240 [Patescibacteria group bacterium]|nr:hypothetical protein [Patescibacteria group bacterium]
MTKIEKAILQTLAFFDIFKRPLTLEELWHNLYRTKTSKIQILFALRALQKKKIVVEKDSYFLLNEPRKNFAIFERQKQICQKRWLKIQRIIKFLRYAPFVKNISVINSLAFNASNENSDIDIFIITQKNRLWTARAAVVMILEFLGQNKNKWYQANKFCLGFALTVEKLNLENLRLKKDIYFTYWLAMLMPILDRKMYQKFILENAWILKELPNWQEKNIESFPEKKTKLEKILSGRFGEALESFLGHLQIKKIWLAKENHRLGASVVADFQMMKLHAYDRRNFYQIQWQEKLKALKI